VLVALAGDERANMNAASHAIDLSLVVEQEKRTTFKTVAALSSRSKLELDTLLDEGLGLLGALPVNLAAAVCAAASENAEASPLASVMCDAFLSQQLTSTLKSHSERSSLYVDLENLVIQGAQLLQRVNQTMVRERRITHTFFRHTWGMHNFSARV